MEGTEETHIPLCQCLHFGFLPLLRRPQTVLVLAYHVPGKAMDLLLLLGDFLAGVLGDEVGGDDVIVERKAGYSHGGQRPHPARHPGNHKHAMIVPGEVERSVLVFNPDPIRAEHEVLN